MNVRKKEDAINQIKDNFFDWFDPKDAMFEVEEVE